MPNPDTKPDFVLHSTQITGNFGKSPRSPVRHIWEASLIAPGQPTPNKSIQLASSGNILDLTIKSLETETPGPVESVPVSQLLSSTYQGENERGVL